MKKLDAIKYYQTIQLLDIPLSWEKSLVKTLACSIIESVNISNELDWQLDNLKELKPINKEI